MRLGRIELPLQRWQRRVIPVDHSRRSRRPPMRGHDSNADQAPTKRRPMRGRLAKPKQSTPPTVIGMRSTARPTFVPEKRPGSFEFANCTPQLCAHVDGVEFRALRGTEGCVAIAHLPLKRPRHEPSSPSAQTFARWAHTSPLAGEATINPWPQRVQRARAKPKRFAIELIKTPVA